MKQASAIVSVGKDDTYALIAIMLHGEVSDREFSFVHKMSSQT